MFKLFVIKFLLAVIPLLFVAYFPLESQNIELIFGLQMGAILGMILSKYINGYGKKNIIIFGTVLFIAFSYQFFTNKTSVISIISLVMAGLGYGIICYQVFYDAKNNPVHIYPKKQKILLYIYFICLYINLGLAIVCYCAKLNYLYNNQIFSFLTLVLYVLIISIIQLCQFSQTLQYNKHLILIIIGLWICAIASDIIVIIFGSILITISCGFIFKNLKNIFLNPSINFAMLVGYVISSGMIFIFNKNIDITNFYYLSFVSCVILLAVYNSFLKSINKI